MTSSQDKDLKKGTTQSPYDERKFKDGNGNSMIRVSENRTIINGKTVYGYSDAKKEKNKW